MPLTRSLAAIALGAMALCAGCAEQPPDSSTAPPADLVLTDARVYTLRWAEPDAEGVPASGAPRDADGWHPDAQAIAARDGTIVFVGSNAGAQNFIGPSSRVISLQGATVVPGLIDSHTHVFELGALLERVNLTAVTTEAEAVALVAERAASTPKGEWIIGAGWDEGAWANAYPDKRALSEAVPDHPVFLRSLHGFGGWVNQAAIDQLGITADTPVPVGGEMRLGADGEPGGIFLNRALELLDNGIPAPTPDALERHLLAALDQMASDGYVAVHEAGADAAAMAVLEKLEAGGRLPVRVYAMLSLRDEPLIRKWIARGPDRDSDSMLVTRAVKAYYDGALGSRGARLLEDYSDMPGHRGVSGEAYGFNEALNAEAMKAGFQIAIHAIGDAGNREALTILESVFKTTPATANNRHRIEHAQVLHPDDMPRLSRHGIIASMEPPHAMEDKSWAEDRLGPDRIAGAYAWRSLRRAGARLTFNADNPGSDHSIFYGLHSAIARKDKQGEPAGGWYPGEAVTPEEALRAYTNWSAYASFSETQTGTIAVGLRADLTVMDIDPFVLGDTDPAALLGGSILMTVVDGGVLYSAAGFTPEATATSLPKAASPALLR